jgi:hypothetical protein
MREWDEAAYERKWCGTIALVQSKTEQQTVAILEVNAAEFRGFLNHDPEQVIHRKWNVWEPIYKYLPAGFISRNACIWRKHCKSFSVGIGAHNYRLAVFSDAGKVGYSQDITSDAWRYLDLVKPFTISEADKARALAEYGAISKRLYLSTKVIWYLAEPIGTRQGKDFQLNFPAYKQELMDTLKGVM